ncbi:MAG: endo-1,4-beta-xylanase [Bacteroidota bacterium]
MSPRLLISLLFVVGLAGCVAESEPVADTRPALKDAFAEAFMVGAALNSDQFFERDTDGAELVKAQFNTITPENVMKWERVQPEPGVFTFDAADQFVAFGEANDLFIVGHTLVWHSQTPSWVFEDGNGNPTSRDTLIAQMRNHVTTMVTRYKGRVDGWDVVNEALNDDGTMRETPWQRIIGDEYLAMAFEFAHAADPDAELYYNDYSLENAAKRDGAVRLVQGLLDAGVRVDGVGTQAHHMLDANSPSVEAQSATIEAFAALGVDVMITELDIAVLPRPSSVWGADVNQRAAMREGNNPYTAGLPDSVQAALAQRYADLFDVFMAHKDDISRVTFWGVSDGDSWLNGWPIEGRTSYPLLFDRAHQPKPAFDAVLKTASR